MSALLIWYYTVYVIYIYCIAWEGYNKNFMCSLNFFRFQLGNLESVTRHFNLSASSVDKKMRKTMKNKPLHSQCCISGT